MGLSHSCILVGRENADGVLPINIQGLFGTVTVVNRRLAFDECWEIVDEDDSLIGATFEETFFCLCGSVLSTQAGEALWEALVAAFPEQSAVEFSVVESTDYALFSVAEGGVVIRQWDSDNESDVGPVLPEEKAFLSDPVSRTLSIASRVLGCPFLQYDWEQVDFEVWRVERPRRWRI